VPVLAGTAHADRAAHPRSRWRRRRSPGCLAAPSFTDDVELDFAKAAGKFYLLRGRNVLIAEEDDGVIIVGVFDMSRARATLRLWKNST
jgi:hypothetical protein